MLSTPIIICIVLIFCIANSESLTCYSCFYHDGHVLSDPNCQNKTSSSATKICGQGLQGLSTTSVMAFINANVFLSNDDTTTLYAADSMELTTKISDGITLCSKFTGSLDGKPVVLRSCGFGKRTLDGTCTNSAYLILDGRKAADVLACFCSFERCNDQNSGTTSTSRTSTTSTTTHPNGASYSYCNSTSYLLVAITAYSMYKYLS